jgi:hypothetical protein
MSDRRPARFRFATLELMAVLAIVGLGLSSIAGFIVAIGLLAALLMRKTGWRWPATIAGSISAMMATMILGIPALIVYLVTIGQIPAVYYAEYRDTARRLSALPSTSPLPPNHWPILWINDVPQALKSAFLQDSGRGVVV